MVITLSINGESKIQLWIRHDVKSGWVSGIIIGSWRYLWGKSKAYGKVFRLKG